MRTQNCIMVQEIVLPIVFGITSTLLNALQLWIAYAAATGMSLPGMSQLQFAYIR